MSNSPPDLNTRSRAEAVATALAPFPHAMNPVSADALLELVRTELGDARALDDFSPRGSIKSMAIAPRSILHIVSGNTPNAAIQSVALGVLSGSCNRVKLPSNAPAVAAAVQRFVEALPNALQERIETAQQLPESWLLEAPAVIVYGSDETVAHFRSRIRPWQKFVGHGHKLSFAIIFGSADADAAEKAARDVSLFDQQGCLSVHDIYVQEDSPGDARHFAEMLARAMQEYNEREPRGTLSAGAAQEIAHLRSSYAFRAANDDRVAVLQSESSTDWTVIYEQDPQFAVSCLNRLVFVKPLPELTTMNEHLRLVRPHLSTIAVWPPNDRNMRAIAELGATRICQLGSSQSPSPFWHQDGLPALASLVDWIDIG